MSPFSQLKFLWELKVWDFSYVSLNVILFRLHGITLERKNNNLSFRIASFLPLQERSQHQLAGVPRLAAAPMLLYSQLAIQLYEFTTGISQENLRLKHLPALGKRLAQKVSGSYNVQMRLCQLGILAPILAYQVVQTTIVCLGFLCLFWASSLCHHLRNAEIIFSCMFLIATRISRWSVGTQYIAIFTIMAFRISSSETFEMFWNLFLGYFSVFRKLFHSILCIF